MVFRRRSILRQPRSKKASRPKTRLSVMPLEDRTLLSGGSLAALLQQGYIGPQPTPDQLQALSSDPGSQALHIPPLGVVTVAAALPPSNSPLNAITFGPSAGADLGSGNDDGPSHGPAFANGDPSAKNLFAGSGTQQYSGKQIVTIPSGNVLVNNQSLDGAYAGFTQSETANLVFGNTIVVGYNDSKSFSYNGLSSKFTGFSVSTDGGNTFTDEGALPTNPNGDLGDPVLARDNANGTVYFATLAYSSFYNTPAVQVFRSADGVNYQAPVNAAPGLHYYDFPDKDWLTVDNYSGAGQHNVYVSYTDFGSGTRIVLSSSVDGGTTWGPNGGTTLATGNVQGSFVIVAPDHGVDVFWLDGNASNERIMMRRSTDQGQTFAAAVTVATLVTHGGNGDLGLGFRTNAFPHVAVNPANGDLYVAYNDKAGSDRSNIYLAQSNDGGATWSAPVQVNDDATTNDQWQPVLAVKPNGTQLFVGWYDRRLDTNNAMIDTFGAVANINAATHAVSFQPNFRVTDQSFPAVYGRDYYVSYYYMGDYDTASADNTNFYYTWGDNRLVGTGGFNQPDVRFAKIVPAFEVTSASPGNGDFASGPPTDFVVHFDDAYAASSITANLLTVNGITASKVTQTDANTLTFHFNASPVTHEGPQTVAMAAGVVARAANGDPLQAFNATFYYDTLRLQAASTSPAANSSINLPGHLILHFNEAVAASSINTSNLVLNAGTVTAAAAVASDATSVDYTITGPASLDGKTLTVALPIGALLDTDGNPGLGFTANYSANILVSPYPTPLTADAPVGSLIYDPSVSATIGFPGDTDSFTISLDPGQTASVVVTADAALQPGVALIAPDGTTILGSATAGSTGAAAVLQTVPITTAGMYTVTVSGANSTTGAFTVRLTLNAALQNELYGVTPAKSDDTIAGAQDLSGAFLDLGGGVSRAAVLGKVPGGVVAGDVWVLGRAGTLALLGNAGNTIKQIGNPAFSSGVLSDVELGQDNSVYVALDVGANPANGEILRLDTDGNLLATIHLPPDGGYYYYYPFGFDVASDGSLWVPQPNTGKVIHTDGSGNLLASYSVGGVPEDAAVRSDGQVFIANAGSDTVQQLDPVSGATTVFASGLVPLGLNFTPSGDLWVSDVNLGVRRFDGSGHQKQFIAGNGVIDPQVDPAGNLFVTHPGIGSVDKFDPSGNLLTRTFPVGTPIGLAVVGIDAPAPPLPDVSDYYSFSMTAGQMATIALTDLDKPIASLDIEDGSGNSLALGRTVDTNVHQVISNFLARTTGTYYAHVGGNGARYSLVVTRNADFDLQNNHRLAQAQDFSGVGSALGEVTTGSRPVTVPANRENSYGGYGNGYPFSLGFFGVASQRYQQIYSASAFSSGGTVNQIRFRRDSAPFSTTGINVQISLGYAATTTSTISTTYANNIGSGYVTVFDGLLSLSSSGVGNPNPFDIVINVSPLFTYDPTKGNLLLDVRMRNSPSTAYFDAVAFDPSVARIYNFDVNAPTGSKDFTYFGLVTQFGMQDYQRETYQLSTKAGDHLVISTRTPAGDPQAPFEPHNLLDPAVQLYDPSGTLVAFDDNSGPDGKNAALSYTALATGMYRVQILGANFSVGDYVLSALGATGSLPPFDVTATNPAANALVRSIPSITVDFNDSVYLGGMAASALTVDGMPATGLKANNDHQVTWYLPALSGVGDDVPHAIAIAAGALTNIHGTPIDAFSETIYVDNVPPIVAATSIEEGNVLPLGPLTYQVTFSEPIIRSSVSTASFDLLGDFRKIHFAPTSFSFDSTNTILTISFPALPDDRYTLTLFSSGFQDRVLYHLDGEPHTPRPPSVPSGDGVEGGDFFVDFAVDFSSRPYPTPLGAENPLGSLIYDPTVTNVISYPGDTHSYTINLDPGQTLTMAVTAGASLQPTITLYNPANTAIGNASAAAIGKDAVLQTIPITQGGTYTVTVGGTAGSMGLYTTQLVLNAAVQNELHGGTSDDTIAGAQDISGSFVNLGVGGSRGAVLGQLHFQLPAGSVLVNERNVNDIAVFDNAGNLLRKIANSALQAGYIQSVQLAPDNSIYAGVAISPGVGKLVHLDVSGNLLDTIHLPNDSYGNSFYPFGFDVAPDGTIWVPKPNSAHVVHIDASGNVLQDYYVGGLVEDAAVRADGQVFVANANGSVLQLDPASGAVSRFASVGFTLGVSFAASGGNGDLLVSDYYTGVRFFNNSGVQDKLIPVYLANHAEVDLSGNLFVPSFDFGSLRKFDPSGNLLFNKQLAGNPTHVSVVGVDAPLPPPPDTSDYYSFTLTAGQSATIAVKGLDQTPVHVDLEDSTGHVMAVGTAVATNVDEVIDRYMPAGSGTVYVHVTGTGGHYSVVVTRGSTFGIENNDDAAHAQDVTNSSGVLAALSKPPTVALSTNFDGLNSDNNSVTISPPDTTVAVGPNHVIEATNLALRIMDKAGNNLLTEQFSTLFAPLGTSYLSDPQIVYDDIAGRWYAAILDISYSFSFSDILLAVSKDSNPLDGFNEMQRIHVGYSDLLDFEKVGFNNDAVVITANDFYYGYYATSLQVVAIDKSSILDGKTSTFTDYVSQRDSSHFRAMVPAQMHGSKHGDPMYFVEEAGYRNGNAARVVTMTNVLTNLPSFIDTDLPVVPYAAPPSALQPGYYVNTNDTTFTRADWRNGMLVSAQSVSEPDDGYSTARVRWYEFNTAGATPTLVQQGSIHPGAGISTYYGTVALDTAGNIGMTYMESSSGEFVSMYVTGRLLKDPLGVMVPGTLVKAGNSQLYGYFRAGDYSGIGLDPADGQTFWVANEYKGNSFWNTYVASFQAMPRPAEDWYRLTLPVDSFLRLTTTVPGSGPGEFANSLTPHLELYDSFGKMLASGTLLGDGLNEQLAFAAHGGSYRIHVVGANNTFGEYFVNVASTPLPAGLLLLDPSSQGALNVGGKGSLIVGGGGKIIVDSKNSAAAIDSGSGNVVAGEIDVTGVPGTQTTGGGTFVGTIKNGVTPTADPLLSLAAPTPPVATYAAVNYSGSAPLILKPGTYNGGINISGPGPVTLMPGIYYMKGGGFVLSSQGSLTGYGVMIFNAPATSSDVINLSGQGVVALTAPTDGAYAGTTVFQDRSSKNPVTLSGGSSLNVTGTVYAAGAVINLSGNGGLVGSLLIGKDIMVSGNGSFRVNTQVQRLSGNDSSSAGAGSLVLINSAGDLLTGQVWIAVGGLEGGLAAAEQARIDAALAALNSDLQQVGVSLVAVTGADAAWATIHITLAGSSDIGGVADGVLGVTEGNDITIVNGWNYYVGDDAINIGSDQYDFQTVITHELGHALGLGHSQDTASVMYPYLAPGDVRHDLSANDLKTIEAVEAGAPEPLRALPGARHAQAQPAEMEDLQTRSPAPAAKEAAAAPQPTTALISSHVLPSAAIQEALGVKADSAAFRFSVQILDTAAPAPGGGPVQGATSAVFSAFDSALPTSTWSRLASRASLLTDLAIRPLGQPVMLNSGLQAFVPEDKSPEWPQNPDDVPDSIPGRVPDLMLDQVDFSTAPQPIVDILFAGDKPSGVRTGPMSGAAEDVGQTSSVLEEVIACVAFAAVAGDSAHRRGNGLEKIGNDRWLRS